MPARMPYAWTPPTWDTWRLTRAEVRASWASLPPDQPVGKARSTRLCPLARYVTRREGRRFRATGDAFRHVSRQAGTGLLLEHHRAPGWTHRFMRRVDRQGGLVTAAQALAWLDQIAEQEDRLDRLEDQERRADLLLHRLAAAALWLDTQGRRGEARRAEARSRVAQAQWEAACLVWQDAGHQRI